MTKHLEAKEVTMLRNVNGDQISVILDSEDFKES